MMGSHQVFHFAERSVSSFRRTPESIKIEYLLDAGVRRHDGKLRIPRPSKMESREYSFQFLPRGPNFVGVKGVFARILQANSGKGMLKTVMAMV
jgi:hypothetical protein